MPRKIGTFLPRRCRSISDLSMANTSPAMPVRYSCENMRIKPLQFTNATLPKAMKDIYGLNQENLSSVKPLAKSAVNPDQAVATDACRDFEAY